MTVLVVGGSGMLGSDVVSELQTRGHQVLAPSREALDIADPMSAARVGAGELGDFSWCVNCAAYTAVDKAESDVDAAVALNTLGPGYLSRACAMAGAPILHVSTDFVFDGEKGSPYTEEDMPNPLGVYGRSKRDGEDEVFAGNARAGVVRTAWLYGPNGNCFPKTIIRAWRAGKPLRVVADQKGSPTYTADLARTLVDLIEKNPEPGIYHAAGPDIVSWHEFAVAACEAVEDGKVEIDAIRTEDWPTPAKRPKYSALDCSKLQGLGIAPMRPLHEALAEFVSQLID